MKNNVSFRFLKVEHEPPQSNLKLAIFQSGRYYKMVLDNLQTRRQFNQKAMFVSDDSGTVELSLQDFFAVLPFQTVFFLQPICVLACAFCPI